MVDPNPYDSPTACPSDDAAALKTPADDQPAGLERLVIVAFCGASYFAIAAYVGANFYARAYDPWLTPRWTPSMMVWRGIGTPMFQFMLFLVPLGAGLAFIASNRKQRRRILIPVGIMTLLPILLGMPG